MNKKASKLEDTWTPFSWQHKPLYQPVLYQNWQQVDEICSELSLLPPLVTLQEIQLLQKELEMAQLGEKFILVAGECVELFEWATPERTESSIHHLKEMTAIFERALGKQVLTIGRLGGVYAKPRTKQWQWVNGRVLPNYLGDLINGQCILDRIPDPLRMIQGYVASRTILEQIRKTNPIIYSAHELFHLPYEQSFIRDGYNHSAHMHWIGERTRAVNGAHVEMSRGLLNPKAVKVGPRCSPSELEALLNTCRGCFIILRLGFVLSRNLLPCLLKVIPHDTLIVLDPMHGNTRTLPSGIKVRTMQDILGEIELTQTLLRKAGRILNGLFLETTLETEGGCYDAFMDEEPVFKAICDPGLTMQQVMKVACTLNKDYLNDTRSPRFARDDDLTYTDVIANLPKGVKQSSKIN